MVWEAVVDFEPDNVAVEDKEQDKENESVEEGLAVTLRLFDRDLV